MMTIAVFSARCQIFKLSLRADDENMFVLFEERFVYDKSIER